MSERACTRWARTRICTVTSSLASSPPSMAMTRYVDRKKKFSVITFLDPGQTRNTVDAIRVSAQDPTTSSLRGGINVCNSWRWSHTFHPELSTPYQWQGQVWIFLLKPKLLIMILRCPRPLAKLPRAAGGSLRGSWRAEVEQAAH